MYLIDEPNSPADIADAGWLIYVKAAVVGACQGETTQPRSPSASEPDSRRVGACSCPLVASLLQSSTKRRRTVRVTPTDDDQQNVLELLSEQDGT